MERAALAKGLALSIALPAGLASAKMSRLPSGRAGTAHKA
jgi:hypothetical protein